MGIQKLVPEQAGTSMVSITINQELIEFSRGLQELMVEYMLIRISEILKILIFLLRNIQDWEILIQEIVLITEPPQITIISLQKISIELKKSRKTKLTKLKELLERNRLFQDLGPPLTISRITPPKEDNINNSKMIILITVVTGTNSNSNQNFIKEIEKLHRPRSPNKEQIPEINIRMEASNSMT